MSGIGGGGVFKFRRLLSRKRTSLDFDLFSLRLFSVADVVISISAGLLLTLAAGMTRYVSSVDLMNVLPELSGLRSAAVSDWSNARALYNTGSDISCTGDFSIKLDTVRVTFEKVCQLIVDRCRVSQLGQQRRMPDGVERLGKIQGDNNNKWIGLEQVGNSME